MLIFIILKLVFNKNQFFLGLRAFEIQKSVIAKVKPNYSNVFQSKNFKQTIKYTLLVLEGYKIL